RLNDPDAALAEGLNEEGVIAVEKAADEKLAQPTEDAWRFNLQDCDLERSTGQAGRLNFQLQPGSSGHLPLRLMDHGIPSRIGREVGKDLPHALLTRRYFDLRMNLPHGWPPAFARDLLVSTRSSGSACRRSPGGHRARSTRVGRSAACRRCG